MLSLQVKFSADRQTDGQTEMGKTRCSQSIDAGDIKNKMCL